MNVPRRNNDINISTACRATLKFPKLELNYVKNSGHFTYNSGEYKNTCKLVQLKRVEESTK